MSEEASWNKDWWREARTLSLERKGGKTPASALAKPGDACLIVTEGTVTEPIYFTLLRSALQLSVVHIKVTPGDHTDPRQVSAPPIHCEMSSYAKVARACSP